MPVGFARDCEVYITTRALRRWRNTLVRSASFIVFLLMKIGNNRQDQILEKYRYTSKLSRIVVESAISKDETNVISCGHPSMNLRMLHLPHGEKRHNNQYHANRNNRCSGMPDREYDMK